MTGGDTLWSIAAQELGSGASGADIDQRWREWYAANVDLIGDDPDYLRPGWELLPPSLL